MKVKTEGLYTQSITGHGKPYTVEYGAENSSHVMSGYEAAGKLKGLIDRNTKHVLYKSCDSGVGGKFSNAQVAADTFGVPVTGFKGNANNFGTGDKVTYQPQTSKLDQKVSAWGNQARHALNKW